MQEIRKSNVDEYVEWYLLREQRKHPSLAVPGTPPERWEIMQKKNQGKLRDWFKDNARWSVALIDKCEDFENLIFFDADWTKKEGLVIDGSQNFRLLGKVADRAIASSYLWNTTDMRHLAYYIALRKCHFRLDGTSRIVICSANKDEKRNNPDMVNIIFTMGLGGHYHT